MGMVNEENIKLIFGLKVKLLRQHKGLSLAELSKLTDISISYLNEIEKGKKYPKANKVSSLADALGSSYDWLVSLKLEKRLAPLAGLLQSNILSELPLEIFGLEPRNLLELISDAPDKLNAFISTLIEISRHYNMTVENFYFSALRSYQQMYDNYFEDLEKAADDARHTLWKGEIPTLAQLEKYVTETCKLQIDRTTFAQFPALQGFRYVVSTKGGGRKLILNDKLTPRQEAFVYCREIGYHLLGLTERSYTYSWTDVDSFDEILNNFRATYFAGALLIPQDDLVKDLKDFLNWEAWESDKFVDMMAHYNASPEMFIHRMTSLLPRHFGMQKLFYLRLNHEPTDDTFVLTKELHMSGQHTPHGTIHNEHHCRRWISISVINDLIERQKANDFKTICGAQISSYIDSGNQYFCISVARPMYPTPDVDCSITLGFVFDEEFKRKVKFWNSPNVTLRLVNEACERCSVHDCQERVAAPTGLDERRKKQLIRESLDEILMR